MILKEPLGFCTEGKAAARGGTTSPGLIHALGGLRGAAVPDRQLAFRRGKHNQAREHHHGDNSKRPQLRVELSAGHFFTPLLRAFVAGLGPVALFIR
jgi:hypothetical protein